MEKHENAGKIFGCTIKEMFGRFHYSDACRKAGTSAVLYTGEERKMKQVDKTAKIWEPTVILDANREIIIGPDCRIGQFCFIAPKKLVMERGAEISPLVALGGGGDVYMRKYSTVDYGAKLIPATFTTQGKYMNDAIFQENPKAVETIRGSITLEEGATIGANAVVCVSRRCPHITIGAFSVIGAESYIDHNIAPNLVMFPKRKDFVVKQRLFK